ncbi:MAG TPA: GntR family transcriptional regulator, partial [Chloroflexota bacterium]|nr:GntR family transcriptional regulator [Chloroflexota bacterium]
DAVRRRILEGHLQPGQRLNEADVAATLDVSRGPVREAFWHLVGEGLLVYQPNRGVSVWRPARDDLRELSLVRAGIEGVAVRQVLEVGGAPALALRLAPLVAAMDEADRRRDRPRAARLDGQFHAAIIDACANARLRRLWATMHPAVWVAGLPALFPLYELPMARSHRALLAAIEGGSPRDAQEALIQHIRHGLAGAAAPAAPASSAGGAGSSAPGGR